MARKKVLPPGASKAFSPCGENTKNRAKNKPSRACCLHLASPPVGDGLLRRFERGNFIFQGFFPELQPTPELSFFVLFQAREGAPGGLRGRLRARYTYWRVHPGLSWRRHLLREAEDRP